MLYRAALAGIGVVVTSGCSRLNMKMSTSRIIFIPTIGFLDLECNVQQLLKRDLQLTFLIFRPPLLGTSSIILLPVFITKLAIFRYCYLL